MAPIKITIPPPLVKWAGFASTSVEGKTVGEALGALDRLQPGLSDRFHDERGEVRRHILIYVNDTEVRELQGLNTPLRGGESLTIVAAVSGG